MTSTPSAALPVLPPATRAGGLDPSVAEGVDALSVDPLDVIADWFVVTCHREDLGHPFRGAAGHQLRDIFAVDHVERTGHGVILSATGDLLDMLGSDRAPALSREWVKHLAARLDRDSEGWTWTCTGPVCGKPNGPFATGQLAIVSWESHQRRVFEREARIAEREADLSGEMWTDA